MKDANETEAEYEARAGREGDGRHNDQFPARTHGERDAQYEDRGGADQRFLGDQHGRTQTEIDAEIEAARIADNATRTSRRDAAGRAIGRAPRVHPVTALRSVVKDLKSQILSGSPGLQPAQAHAFADEVARIADDMEDGGPYPERAPGETDAQYDARVGAGVRRGDETDAQYRARTGR